jgi:hypothetical protein
MAAAWYCVPVLSRLDYSGLLRHTLLKQERQKQKKRTPVTDQDV